MTERDQADNRHHVVIVGGGFGGLYAAKELMGKQMRVTLIDKRNFHLFQPLLYQVATGGLSPGDIASPLRSIFKKGSNIWVIQDEVVDVDPDAQKVILKDGEISYDSVIVAVGSGHHYFGNPEWALKAPGLKTVEDALNIRRRIFQAFEAAELESDPDKRAAWQTFIVVGGGPTGVELAGALGELAHQTLRDDFDEIDPDDTRIFLVEGRDRILPAYAEKLSIRAAKSLEKLGVSIQTGTLVTDITDHSVTIKTGDDEKNMKTRTVLWAAGVSAAALGNKIADRIGAETDRGGRIKVNPYLNIPGHDNIYVIGDLARFDHQRDEPLPGLAPVAMQQGRYAAKRILERCRGQTSTKPFRYRDRGMLSVIGRNSAVAQFGRLKMSGFLAWIVWIFVHIAYLIEYDNKLIVLIQWAQDYFTRKRGARLITDVGREPDDMQK